VIVLGWGQIVVFFAVVVAITPLLGAYMARVYTGERVLLARVLGPCERGIYRVIRACPPAMKAASSSCRT